MPSDSAAQPVKLIRINNEIRKTTGSGVRVVLTFGYPNHIFESAHFDWAGIGKCARRELLVAAGAAPSHGVTQYRGERFAAWNVGFANAEHPPAGPDDAAGDLIDHPIIPCVRMFGEGDGAVRLVDRTGNDLIDIHQHRLHRAIG